MLNKLLKKININEQTVRTIASYTVMVGGLILISQNVLAADDAFGLVHTKVHGWVSGTFGKLITFISLITGLIMGIAGFPGRHILGAMGIGLVLSSANAIVNMLF